MTLKKRTEEKEGTHFKFHFFSSNLHLKYGFYSLFKSSEDLSFVFTCYFLISFK